MSKNKICVACGFEDFEDNINNFCCNCGKDIDTGLTLEEMDKQGINYIIDKRVNKYKFSSPVEYENTSLEPKEVEQLKKENEELKSAQNKLAIETLEKVLDFIYSNKWTNIELCVDNSPLKIIRNKLDTMIAELRGKDE